MAPTGWFPTERYRSKEGLGVWEHRGKVAATGFGQAPIARRWDESLETSLGALTIDAVEKALADSGLRRDQIDGVVSCPQGMGDSWGPIRPFFDPPYDSEDGLSGVSADWIVREMGLDNVKVTYHAPGCMSTALVAGSQVVGDGEAKNVLVIRGTGNMPGRYHQTPGDTASGGQQFTNPWGWQLIPQIAFGFDQYCRKYGTNHDKMAPYVLNNRRNGARQPLGYYYQHRPDDLNITVEDYLAARWICKPMNIYDCDLPIQTAAAFIFSTAEIAKDLKQKPVYVLNHVTQRGVVRSSVETLAETEEFSASIAKKSYEGSGLTPKDVDLFNPYDGFTLFTQYFLEGFQWHGVGLGEAHDFYGGDIRVEGPHPFNSSGCNNGNGRTRWWGYIDCMEQLREQAGTRQVTIKNGRPETGIAGAFTPGHSDWMIYGTSPD